MNQSTQSVLKTNAQQSPKTTAESSLTAQTESIKTSHEKINSTKHSNSQQNVIEKTISPQSIQNETSIAEEDIEDLILQFKR